MDDIQEITNLANSYIEHVDARNYDALGKLFANGSLQFVSPSQEPSKVLQGPENVQRFFERSLSKNEKDEFGRHLLTNLIIDVNSNGDQAKLRCYSIGLRFKSGDPVQVLGAGRYEDEYAKIDDVWYLTKKTINLDAMNNLGQ